MSPAAANSPPAYATATVPGFKLEDVRAYAAYGMNSFVGKSLEIHRQAVGL
jgi:hypothetical protein